MACEVASSSVHIKDSGLFSALDLIDYFVDFYIRCPHVTVYLLYAMSPYFAHATLTLFFMRNDTLFCTRNITLFCTRRSAYLRVEQEEELEQG